jgi:hypothetical protein
MKILAGLVCFSLFSNMAIADSRHYRDEGHHDNNNRSHRGNDIAVAVVVGGIVGYLIANDKDSGEVRSTSGARRWCERNVPPRYENNRHLSKAWVKGCVQRVQEEESEFAEEAYNNGYGR